LGNRRALTDLFFGKSEITNKFDDIFESQFVYLGNMFTDAIRESAGADLAFLPAGYVGGLTEPDPIDFRTVQLMARIEVEILK
jgi:hypothetical protein